MQEYAHCLPDTRGRSFGEVARCPNCGGTFYLWYNCLGSTQWEHAGFFRRVWFYITGKTRI